MSNTIDRKVVEMQFDNAQFEKGVKTSISSIDKLKSSLNFSGLEKSFDNIEKKAGKIDFSGMQNSVTVMMHKFSALEAVAFGALTRMGQRITDTAIKFKKSLSVDNIISGWSKYEEKTKAVGTLMAQGFDMSTVNKQLERLNFFTDETSYSFTNMISEIAKFTATGKGLEDSVTALMGIANWAAMSGQNAQVANRAMYQLSQAMGSGVMRKEDYKSIQNVSMDTKEFRQRALDAAAALGTIKKNADGTFTSIAKGGKKSTFTISQFADHLTQEAWFTSDVMMKVYKDYAYAVDEVQKKMEEEHLETASEAIRVLEKELSTMENKQQKEMLEFGLKALKAAQEARSWQDAVDSAKEAVASGFMKTFEILFGQYDKAVDLWTDLAERFYEEFATPINNFNEKLEEQLRSSTPYIEDFFDSFVGGSEVLKTSLAIVKEYGWGSDQTKNRILSLAKGNRDLASSIEDIIKLNKLDGEGTTIVGASMDSLIEKTAELTNISKEDAAALKNVGDEFGYSSSQYIRKMEEIYGKNKNGMYETVTGLLAVSNGLDVIEQKDLDAYLSGTLKFTSDQVEELHKLADEYGANSEQVDNYIKSLTNFKNFGYGNRGWTRTAIKSLLEITDGVGKSTYPWEAGDVAGYIKEITGASEENVKILLDLVEEKKELESATEKDTDAIAKNQEQLNEYLNTIAGEDEEMRKRIMNIIDLQKQIDNSEGYRNLLEGLKNIWDYIIKIKEIIKSAFNDVFGGKNKNAIYNFTKGFKDFTDKLTLSDEQADKLKRVFSGLFSVFKILGQIIKPILIPIKVIFSELIGGTKELGKGAASIGDWITQFAESGKAGEKATAFFTRVGEVIRPIVRAFKSLLDFKSIKSVFEKSGKGIAGVFSVIGRGINIVIGGIFDMISEITGWDVSDVKEKVLGFLTGIKDKITDILPNQENLKNGFEKIKGIAKDVLGFLGIGKKQDTGGMDDATESVEGFSTAVGDTTQNLDILGGKLKDFFGGFKDITETVTGAADTVKSSGILTGFSGFFTKLKTNIDKADFSDIFDKLLDGGKVAGLIMFAKSIGDMGKGFKKAGEGIKTFGQGFADNGIFGKDSIFKRETKDWTVKVKRIAEAIVLLAAALWLVSKVPADRVWECFGVVSALVGVLAVAYIAMEKFSKKGGGKGTVGMVGFAIGILLLVKAVEKIAAIKTDNIWNAAGVVMALAGTLAVCMLIMSFGKSGKVIASAIAAIIMVKAVTKLADVVVKIADKNYDTSTLWNAAGVVMAMAGVLSVCMLLMSFGKGTFKALLGAVGALILVKAVANLSEVVFKMVLIVTAVKPITLWTAIGIVAGMAVLLGVMVFVFSKFKVSGIIGVLAAAVSMILIVGAVEALVKVLSKMISIIDTVKPKTLELAVEIIAGIMFLLTLIVMFISEEDPKKSLAAAGSMVIIAIAVGIIAEAITRLANGSDTTSMKQAAKMLAIMVGVITAALVILSLIPSPGSILAVAGAFLILSIGIGIIAGSLWLFVKTLQEISGMTSDDFEKGLTRMADGLDFLLKRLKKSIPTIAATLMALPVALGRELKKHIEDISELGRNILSILIKSALGALNDNLSDIAETVLNLTIQLLDLLIEHAPEIVDKLLTLFIELLHGIAEHIEEITDEVFNIIIGVLNGISKNIGEVIDKIFEICEEIVNGVINGLKDMDLPPIEDIIDALGKIHELMLLTSAYALDAPLAIGGAAALSLFALEVISLLGAFGAINELLPDLQNYVKSGGELVGSALGTLGGMIGKFYGALIGEVAATSLTIISEALPSIGENLTAFVTEAAPFFNEVKTWDPSIFTPFGSLVTALADITKNDIITRIIEIFAGDGSVISKFGSSVGSMADALKIFIEKLRTLGIDDEDVARADRAATVIEKLATIANKLPALKKELSINASSLFSLTNISVGYKEEKQTMEGFAKGMEELATGISVFAEKTKSIEVLDEGAVDGIDRAVSIIEKLETISNSLPNLFIGIKAFAKIGKNGFAEATASAGVEKQDLSSFSRGIENLATGISIFVDKTKDISVPDEGTLDGVDRAITIIEKLQKISKELPTLLKGIDAYASIGKGYLAEVDLEAGFKQQDIASFGMGLKNIGDGISSFVDSVKGITKEDKASADLAVEIVGDIAEIADELPNIWEGFKLNTSGLGSESTSWWGLAGKAVGGLFSGPGGFLPNLDVEAGVKKLSMTEFSDALSSIGEGIKGFATVIDESGLSETKITGYANLLESANSILWYLSDKSVIPAAVESSKQLPNIAVSIKDFVDKFKGYDDTGLDDVNMSLAKLDYVLDNLAAGHDFTNLNAFLMQFTYPWYSKNVEDNISGMKDAFDVEKHDDVFEAISDFVDNILSKFEDCEKGFKESGENCADGFIAGLLGRKDVAKTEAGRFGKAVLEGLNSSLEEKSPSKATERSGIYFVQGFTGAVESLTDSAEETTKELGQGALDGLRDALSGEVNGIDGIDNTFTIRPVMDLSGIQNGVDGIDGMLGGLNGYSVDGSMNFGRAALESFQAKNQANDNANFDRLISAVNDLGDKLDIPDQTNNFNITGADADEIVERVIRELSKLVNRRGREWA